MNNENNKYRECCREFEVAAQIFLGMFFFFFNLQKMAIMILIFIVIVNINKEHL